MTTLIYNGVYLRDCETRSFEQSLEYDSSDTDLMFSRFKIRVSSTVVAIRYPDSSERQFGVDPPQGSTAVQKMHDVQARLSQPRKDFWFIIESCVTDERSRTANAIDQPLLIASGKAFDETIQTVASGGGLVEQIVRTPRKLRPHPGLPDTADLTTSRYGPLNDEFDASTVLDCNNGPIPKSINVTQIIGGRSLRVEFEIEVCRRICEPDFTDEKPNLIGGLENPNSHVLSNRWYLEESKDDNWITTRTMQGTLRVTDSSWWPHAMRYLCIPGLLRGYKRTRQSFATDPGGLTLKYRVEDQQAHAAPPYPAIKWSARHSEAGTGTMGIKKTGDFQIRLTGPPGVDKVALIGAAGRVAANRIQGLAKKTTNVNQSYSTVIKHAAVTDVLDQPTIELRLRVDYNEDDKYKALALRILEMGKPLTGLDTAGQDSGDDPYIIDGYKPDVWPVPLAYDSKEPAGVFACYLQNPCSMWHGIPGGFPPRSSDPSPGTHVYANEPPEDKESGYPDSASDSEQAAELVIASGSLDPVPLPEDLSNESKEQELYDFPYSFVELQQRYVVNNGWAQMPLAQTNAAATRSAALVKMHAPIATRVLTMQASRDGRMPTIPSLKEEQIDHNGNREILNKWVVTQKSPETGADGTGRRFAVEAILTYYLEKAPGINEKLRGASSPIDLFTSDQHWIDLADHCDTDGHLQWELGTTQTFPAGNA